MYSCAARLTLAQFTGEAQVVAVDTTTDKDDQEVVIVTLDKTWLHPQGGTIAYALQFDM